MQSKRYSRSEWSSLTIQDRIRAMNANLEMDEICIDSPAKTSPADDSTAASSFVGTPTPEDDFPPVTKRSSVVDIWRQREGSRSKGKEKANITSTNEKHLPVAEGFQEKLRMQVKTATTHNNNLSESATRHGVGKAAAFKDEIISKSNNCTIERSEQKRQVKHEKGLYYTPDPSSKKMIKRTGAVPVTPEADINETEPADLALLSPKDEGDLLSPPHTRVVDFWAKKGLCKVSSNPRNSQKNLPKAVEDDSTHDFSRIKRGSIIEILSQREAKDTTTCALTAAPASKTDLAREHDKSPKPRDNEEFTTTDTIQSDFEGNFDQRTERISPLNVVSPCTLNSMSILDETEMQRVQHPQNHDCLPTHVSDSVEQNKINPSCEVGENQRSKGNVLACSLNQTSPQSVEYVSNMGILKSTTTDSLDQSDISPAASDWPKRSSAGRASVVEKWKTRASDPSTHKAKVDQIQRDKLINPSKVTSSRITSPLSVDNGQNMMKGLPNLDCKALNQVSEYKPNLVVAYPDDYDQPSRSFTKVQKILPKEPKAGNATTRVEVEVCSTESESSLSKNTPLVHEAMPAPSINPSFEIGSSEDNNFPPKGKMHYVETRSPAIGKKPSRKNVADRWINRANASPSTLPSIQKDKSMESNVPFPSARRRSGYNKWQKEKDEVSEVKECLENSKMVPLKNTNTECKDEKHEERHEVDACKNSFSVDSKRDVCTESSSTQKGVSTGEFTMGSVEKKHASQSKESQFYSRTVEGSPEVMKNLIRKRPSVLDRWIKRAEEAQVCTVNKNDVHCNEETASDKFEKVSSEVEAAMNNTEIISGNVEKANDKVEKAADKTENISDEVEKATKKVEKAKYRTKKVDVVQLHSDKLATWRDVFNQVKDPSVQMNAKNSTNMTEVESEEILGNDSEPKPLGASSFSSLFQQDMKKGKENSLGIPLLRDESSTVFKSTAGAKDSKASNSNNLPEKPTKTEDSKISKCNNKLENVGNQTYKGAILEIIAPEKSPFLEGTKGSTMSKLSNLKRRVRETHAQRQRRLRQQRIKSKAIEDCVGKASKDSVEQAIQSSKVTDLSSTQEDEKESSTTSAFITEIGQQNKSPEFATECIFNSKENNTTNEGNATNESKATSGSNDPGIVVFSRETSQHMCVPTPLHSRCSSTPQVQRNFSTLPHFEPTAASTKVASETGQSDSALSFFSGAGSAFSGYSAHSSAISSRSSYSTLASRAERRLQRRRGYDVDEDVHQQAHDLARRVLTQPASPSIASSCDNEILSGQSNTALMAVRPGLADKYNTSSRFIDNPEVAATNVNIAASSYCTETSSDSISFDSKSESAAKNVQDQHKGQHSQPNPALLTDAFRDAYNSFNIQGITDQVMELRELNFQKLATELNDGISAASESLRKYVAEGETEELPVRIPECVDEVPFDEGISIEVSYADEHEENSQNVSHASVPELHQQYAVRKALV